MTLNELSIETVDGVTTLKWKFSVGTRKAVKIDTFPQEVVILRIPLRKNAP